MAGGKVYSFQEVCKHGDRNDCWLIIAGKVYDVTPFMEEHPGGDEVLLACIVHHGAADGPVFVSGKDATSDFDDIGHSDSAKQLMPKYCIGELDAATVPDRITYAAVARDDGAKKATTTGAWTTLLQLAVPVLLLALAFALQSYSKAAKAQ